MRDTARESAAALLGVPVAEVPAPPYDRLWRSPRGSVPHLVESAKGDPLPSEGDVGSGDWSRGGAGYYDDGTADGYNLQVQLERDDYGLCPDATTLRRGGWWRVEERGVTAFVSDAGRYGSEVCPCGCGMRRVECHFCRLPAASTREASKGGGKMRDACDGRVYVPAGAVLVARGECADERDERSQEP